MSTQSNFNTLMKPIVWMIASSSDWSPPANCTARVYVIGGGGGGGANKGSSPSVGGGAGGGCAIKTLRLTTDVTYTITIGAGGTRGTTTTSGAYVSGGNAGNTTFAATGLDTLLGVGGKGGLATGNTADGGTAANGDFNFSGESTSYSDAGYNGGVCGVFGSVVTGASKSLDSSGGGSFADTWYGAGFKGGYGLYSSSAATQAASGMVGCGGGSASTFSGSYAYGGYGGPGLVIVEVIGFG